MTRPTVAPVRTAPAQTARGALPTVAAGFGPPLALLAGVAAAVGYAGTGAMSWALAPAGAAALPMAACASRKRVALRGAAGAPAPSEPIAGDARHPILEGDRVEIDHRVRNIVQIVTSLLNLELRRAGAGVERAALLRAQARLHRLSRVHRRRPALDAPPAMRLDVIAGEIADHLFPERTADAASGAAAVPEQAARDPVLAAPELATAFALFVNEALMGAREHLEGEKPAGSVSLSVRATGGGGLLIVSNPACEPGEIGGLDPLGARLMARCAAQLGATLSAAWLGDVQEIRLAMPPRQHTAAAAADRRAETARCRRGSNAGRPPWDGRRAPAPMRPAQPAAGKPLSRAADPA